MRTGAASSQDGFFWRRGRAAARTRLAWACELGMAGPGWIFVSAVTAGLGAR